MVYYSLQMRYMRFVFLYNLSKQLWVQRNQLHLLSNLFYMFNKQYL